MGPIAASCEGWDQPARKFPPLEGYEWCHFASHSQVFGSVKECDIFCLEPSIYDRGVQDPMDL